MQRLMTTLLVLCMVAGLSAAQDAAFFSRARASMQDGATIVVDTQADELVDDGNCSLREAIQAANTDTPVDACPAGGAEDTIQIPDGIYTLDCGTDGLFEEVGLDILTGTVILQGSVITPTTVDGNYGCRVLHVHAGANVTFANLTVIHGHWPIVEENEVHADDPEGAGIRNDGVLQIVNSTITANATGAVWQSPYSGMSRFPGAGVYNTGNLRIAYSTLSNNWGAGGAGVDNSGSLVIDNSTIGSNYGGWGAGVNNSGELVLSNSIVMKNDGGRGAGVYNNGNLTIANSAIISNVGDSGAGVYNNWLLVMTSSTIAGNVSRTGTCSAHGGIHCSGPFEGGGINNAGMLIVTNSTISGNKAGDVSHWAWEGFPCEYDCPDPGGGGGISNSGTLVLENCTIAQNSVGVLLGTPSIRGSGGGVVNSGTLRLRNTLIAGNEDGDCKGTLESLGRNLIENTTVCTLTGDLVGNVIGKGAGVRGLADNGGPTLTHALGGWSAAIDAGNCYDSHGRLITRDQRGEQRPQLGGCDIGAYEAASIEPYDQVWLPAVVLDE